MADFDLDLDGHPSRLTVDDTELEAVHLPLLRRWESAWRRRRGRWIVFLAGPPGAGKSTLAGMWERLALRERLEAPLQALSMDGFHYPNRVLDSRSIVLDGEAMPLRRVKGRPESYDLPALGRALAAIRRGEPVRWPRYDRTTHDPVPDAIVVQPEGIVVVEGLYLLLDQPGWDRLRDEADQGVLLDGPEARLREDVVARKHGQGRSVEDASAHWDLVDHFACRIIADHRRGVDATLRLGAGRRYEMVAEPSDRG